MITGLSLKMMIENIIEILSMTRCTRLLDCVADKSLVNLESDHLFNVEQANNLLHLVGNPRDLQKSFHDTPRDFILQH